jgi:hypothetical protein
VLTEGSTRLDPVSALRTERPLAPKFTNVLEDCRDYGEVVRQWSSLEEWWQEVGEAELRLILWAAWDPIGGVPRDEYDWYVPRLWALLREHGSFLREPPGLRRAT